jgi:hypothetical protein
MAPTHDFDRVTTTGLRIVSLFFFFDSVFVLWSYFLDA